MRVGTMLAGAALAAMVAGGAALAQTGAMTTAPATAADHDPYLWLEDKDGAKPLAWVEAENARTLPRLEGDPRYAAFHAEALAIAAARDRIPAPELTYGRVLNFWRDADHPHGLWRWTTEADYANPEPRWTTLIDLDALGRAEGKTWVWKGATCLEPEERLCLVALSDGGEDAVTYREFDLKVARFVDGGFALPKSKQDVTWLDRDTLLVSRDWGPGTMTQSGYPFVVKEVKRGQPLADAREVFRGSPSDQVSTGSYTLTDAARNRATFIRRGTTFFGAETLLYTPHGAVKLDLPARTRPAGMIDGQLLFRTSDPWGQVPAGAVACPPQAGGGRGGVGAPGILGPGPVAGLAVTRARLHLVVSDNVRGRGYVYQRSAGGWAHRALDLPDNATIAPAAATDRSDHAYLSVTGFLEPTTLFALDASAGQPRAVKRLPPKFDGSADVVEQHEAVSTDGTKIPYFVVRRSDAPLDG